MTGRRHNYPECVTYILQGLNHDELTAVCMVSRYKGALCLLPCNTIFIIIPTFALWHRWPQMAPKFLPSSIITDFNETEMTRKNTKAVISHDGCAEHFMHCCRVVCHVIYTFVHTL